MANNMDFIQESCQTQVAKANVQLFLLDCFFIQMLTLSVKKKKSAVASRIKIGTIIATPEGYVSLYNRHLPSWQLQFITDSKMQLVSSNRCWQIKLTEENEKKKNKTNKKERNSVNPASHTVIFCGTTGVSFQWCI